MIESGPQMIVDGPSITKMPLEMIALVGEMIICKTDIIVSQSSTIIDDVEIIVKETEFIVTIVLSKGKTGGTETDERGVSEVKQSACLVCLGLFPFILAYKACGVPFLTP